LCLGISYIGKHYSGFTKARRNPLRPPIICDPDGQPIDSVEPGRFNSPSTCVIISNAGSLHYSTLGTLLDGHEAIFRLNAGPPQPQSDVGAGTSARIINNQLKAVDFEDDIILQWKPGHWSNLAKDTASACRLGGRHLYHSPINTVDCMVVLTNMGCRGDSPTSNNYRIYHCLHCFPLLPGGNTSPFPHE
jgi:hypothetical protein